MMSQTTSVGLSSKATESQAFILNNGQFPTGITYSALRPRQIRLLTFESEIASGLSCTMKIVTLAYPITYTALSYYWGAPVEPDRLKPVTVNGQKTLLRPTLHTFLCHLAAKFGTITFWLDVLCINQLDIAERQTQVAMMGEIFVMGTNVCVWLGEADSDSDYAFAQMRSLQADRLVVPPHMLSTTLEQLFLRPYWRRMWVIQEFALANDVVLMCGVKAVAWSSLVNIIDRHLQADATLAWQIFKQFKILRKQRLNGKQREGLLTLMLRFQHARCVDIRDKVYALRALARDGSQVTVDYARPPVHLAFRLLHDLTPYDEDVTSLVYCSRNVFAAISTCLPTTKDEMLRHLQDEKEQVIFSVKVSFVGSVRKVVATSPEQCGTFSPNLRPDHRPYVTVFVNDYIFHASDLVHVDDLVFLFNGCHLVFRGMNSTLKRPIDILLAPVQAWQNHVWTRRVLSAVDFDVIRYLFCNNIERCQHSELRAGRDATLHVTSLMFLILLLREHDDQALWTILWDIPRPNFTVAEHSFDYCAAAHSTNDSAALQNVDLPTGPAQWKIWTDAHTVSERARYVECKKASLHATVSFCEQRELEWARANELIRVEHWLPQIGKTAGLGISSQASPDNNMSSLARHFPRMTVHLLLQGNSLPKKESKYIPARYGSCKHITLTVDDNDDIILTARVRTVENTWHKSTLNLDALLANDDGHFRWVEAGCVTGPKVAAGNGFEDVYWPTHTSTVSRHEFDYIPMTLHDYAASIKWVEDGGFSRAARNVRLVRQGEYLEADLRRRNGRWTTDRVRLDERLVVQDGALRYTFFVGMISAGQKSRHMNYVLVV